MGRKSARFIAEMLSNYTTKDVYEIWKDMGLVMKKVNELLVGKNADMSLVSKLVKEQIMSN